MKFERFVTLAESVLASNVSNSATSITVTSGSVFPSDGNFRLKIDSELLLATARSGDTITVQRGIEGTAAAAHSSGSAVKLIATAGGIGSYVQESRFSSKKELGRILDDSGEVTTSSYFSQLNSSGVTYSDTHGIIIAESPVSSGVNVRGLYKSAPSTPYEYVAAVRCLGKTASSDAFLRAGIGFRKDSTGQLNLIVVRCPHASRPQIWQEVYNNETSFFTNNGFQGAPYLNEYWFKIGDNGTNLTFSYSANGSNWIQLASFSRTAYMTGGPDQVIFAFMSNQTTGTIFKLLHWSKQ